MSDFAENLSEMQKTKENSDFLSECVRNVHSVAAAVIRRRCEKCYMKIAQKTACIHGLYGV